MGYLILAFCWVVLCVEVPASGAQKVLTVRGSNFAISAEENIEVDWNGEKLISGDMHSWLAGQHVGAAAEHYEVSRHLEVSGGKGWQYTNAWSTNCQLPFRRELGISPDGKKIEINFQSHQDALIDSYPSDTIFYRMYLPLSTLNNSSWEALTGRSYNATWSSGTLNADTPDGDLVGALARWISFTTPVGKITFDFNPHGVTTYYVAAANNINSQWSVEKRGDRIEMTLAVPATSYGGALTGKVTIFEGDRSVYLDHHAVDYYHYFSEIPAERLFCFGGKSSEAFINAGKGAYDESKGYGWVDAAGIDQAGGELTGALYTAASSARENTFITTHLRPGLYLITMRSSALEQPVGPFHVSLNGGEVFSNISIDKGTVANLTCVRWIEGGIAAIKLEGEWALSVLGYQLFMHAEEDFEFRRGFWLKSDGYCPDVMFSNQTG
jgi:hypothetical protein